MENTMDRQGDERARQLYEQADVIRRSSGIDVMQVFENDPDAQARVKSGEWDFADLARSITSESRVPATARNANGAGVAGRDVRSMSQTEFDRLNEQLSRGYTVQL